MLPLGPQVVLLLVLLVMLLIGVLAVDVAASPTGHTDTLPVVAGAVLGSQPQDVRRKG